MSVFAAFDMLQPRRVAAWMRAILPKAAGMLALFLLLGCDKISRKSEPINPILAPIEEQVKALNRRDAKAAIAVMHPDAPGLARAREATERVTATYDLIYMLQSMTVESATDDEARVRFSQVTQRAGGPEFRGNRVVGIHTLRKYEGKWRIYSTQSLSIDYLDKKPPGTPKLRG